MRVELRESKMRALEEFFRKRGWSFTQDHAGATAIEYAMIASGIAVAIAVAVKSLGTTTQAFYNSLVALFN